MPFSSKAGKSLIALALARFDREFGVPAVVDVGPGVGTYGRMLRRILPRASLTGVEVWGPYVSAHGLAAVYDTVHVCDARIYPFERLPRGGVALFGDVLEHMTADEAQETVLRALLVCDAAILVVPLGPWPQDAYDGNPYEAHVATWSVEAVRDRFRFLAAEVVFPLAAGQAVGVFALARRGVVRRPLHDAFAAASRRLREVPELMAAGLDPTPDFSDPPQLERFLAAVGPHLAG